MRLFTLDEARSLLPALREQVTELRGRKATLDRHHQAFSVLARHATGEGPEARDALTRHRAAIERLTAELQELIAAITAAGVEVKGLDDGLIDFPAERDGRVVYLCWQDGEPDIAWWHELSTGFRGRRPLTEPPATAGG